MRDFGPLPLPRAVNPRQFTVERPVRRPVELGGFPWDCPCPYLPGHCALLGCVQGRTAPK